MNPKTSQSQPTTPRAAGFDYDTCPHSSYVVLAGRKVCNSGCGKDLGPA